MGRRDVFSYYFLKKKKIKKKKIKEYFWFLFYFSLFCAWSRYIKKDFFPQKNIYVY